MLQNSWVITLKLRKAIVYYLILEISDLAEFCREKSMVRLAFGVHEWIKYQLSDVCLIKIEFE